MDKQDWDKARHEWHGGSLSKRTAHTIMAAVPGISSREELAEAIRDGRVSLRRTSNLGVKSYKEACAWAGVTPVDLPEARPLQQKLEKARKLLEEHGYTVHRPTAAPRSGARSGSASPGCHQ